MDDYDLKHIKKGKFGPLDVYPQEEKQKEDELNPEFVKNGFKYVIPDLLREYEFQGLGKEQPLTQSQTFDSDIMRALLHMVARREDSSLFGPGGSHSDGSIGGKGINKQAYGSSSMSGTGPTQSGGYLQSGSSGGSGGQQPMSKPASSNAAAQAAAVAAQQQQQHFKPSIVYMSTNPKTKEVAYSWFRQLASNEPLAKLAKKIPIFNKRGENLPEILITLYEYRVPISRAVWYLKVMVLASAANLNEV